MPASPLRRLLPGLVLAWSTASDTAALPTTTVVLENLVGGNTSPQAVLTGPDGQTPLTAGTVADGDGALVLLGYFTGSTTSAGFTGSWVPLTGPAGANTGVPVGTIGDAGSGAAGPYGHFAFAHDFDLARPQTAQNLPAAGTRLVVAIVNGIAPAASTFFNLATNDAWRWKAPGLLPDFVAINLNDPGTLWFGGPGSARMTGQPAETFPGAPTAARLVNIATRGFVGAGDAAIIPGFVIAGSGTKRVLLRAVGPKLADLAVPGLLPDPVFTIVRQRPSTTLGGNDDWGLQQPGAPDPAAAFATVGAFPLVPGPIGPTDDTRSAAVVLDLPPGGYSFVVRDTAERTGVVIAEAYVVGDAPGDPARLVNLSTRGFVGVGDEVLIPGITLGPGAPRRLLVRAAGPTLAAPPFGIAGTLADPAIEVFATTGGPALAANDDWGAGGQAALIAAAGAAVGAFPLADGSADAALIFTASENSGYTVRVSGVGGTTGLVITEIYELP